MKVFYFLLPLILIIISPVNSQVPPPLPPQPVQPVGPPAVPSERHSVRCYICAWSIAHCSDFNCYNNPDTCTNNNFHPHLVQRADCPGGCEQFVVTDPNGIVQQWRRNCAPGNIITRGFICKTEYQLGIRIDKCFCNKDWCNRSSNIKSNIIILIITFLLAKFLMYKFIHE